MSGIIFFGTSDFATPVLRALINAGYKIGAVVTAPDSKNVPPAKKIAIEHGLEVLQPKNFRDDPVLVKLEKIAKQSDIGIVVDYGKIIPAKFLALLRYGMLNIHGSLLPKYRGPSPIQYALLNGEVKTGVTVFVLDEKIDHGPILGMEREPIASTDKYYSLKMKLVEKGADLLLKLLPKYLNGEIKPQPQDESQATFTKIIAKEDGRIDWNKTAEQIYNQFRAFHKWPGIWTNWRGKILKITGCVISRSLLNEAKKPGEIFQEKGKIYASCKNSLLEIINLQLEGGKVMTAKEFINGYGKFFGKA